MKKYIIGWIGIISSVCSMASGAFAAPLLSESFDTLSTSNSNLFDTHLAADHQVIDGKLILFYSSTQQAGASGIECTLPVAAAEPETRVMEFHFLGGGSDMSNSLFIAYAVGPGQGLSLCPFPAGGKFDDRTGYIIRWIHHGDGTNEVKFYRNDTGWVKELKNDWTLPANPVRFLRRVRIEHSRAGVHRIGSDFDTGSTFSRAYTFTDETYPPNNIQRRIQIAAKGHTSTQVIHQIYTDTWMVEDRPKIRSRR